MLYIIFHCLAKNIVVYHSWYRLTINIIWVHMQYHIIIISLFKVSESTYRVTPAISYEYTISYMISRGDIASRWWCRNNKRNKSYRMQYHMSTHSNIKYYGGHACTKVCSCLYHCDKLTEGWAWYKRYRYKHFYLLIRNATNNSLNVCWTNQRLWWTASL